MSTFHLRTTMLPQPSAIETKLSRKYPHLRWLRHTLATQSRNQSTGGLSRKTKIDHYSTPAQCKRPFGQTTPRCSPIQSNSKLITLRNRPSPSTALSIGALNGRVANDRTWAVTGVRLRPTLTIKTLRCAGMKLSVSRSSESSTNIRTIHSYLASRSRTTSAEACVSSLNALTLFHRATTRLLATNS